MIKDLYVAGANQFEAMVCLTNTYWDAARPSDLDSYAETVFVYLQFPIKDLIVMVENIKGRCRFLFFTDKLFCCYQCYSV